MHAIKSFILTLVLVVLAQADSRLTVYVYPPSQPLNWKSPKTLIYSFLRIQGLKAIKQIPSSSSSFVSDFNEPGSIDTMYMSTMGHTIAHVQCELENGVLYDRWSSLSGEDDVSEDYNLAFKQKIGVGLLFHKFIDGHIISGAENYKRLIHYRGQKYKDSNGKTQVSKPKYLSFSIDPQQCQNLKGMIDFYESFHFPKNTPTSELKKRSAQQTLFFTNVIDPYDSYIERQKNSQAEVGGGCAPYAVGLVKMTGLFTATLDKIWSRLQPVSENLIGGVSASGQTVRAVNMNSILVGKLGNHWMYAGQPNQVVKMYDPQNIWENIMALENCVSKKQCTAELEAIQREFQMLGKSLHVGSPHVFADQYRAGKKEKSVSQSITGLEVR
tara:strand:+ start:4264 stop:5415 length:1152 start_codon:yes stop_codon:yes gene_type:complete